MAEYGVITEQGDLGLGFDVLNDKDQKAYNEAVNREQKKVNTTSTVINESKEKK